MLTEYLAKKCTEFFVQRELIQKDDEELYQLGFDVIISTSFASAVILIMGALLHNLCGAILFLLCFSHIRNYSGGYHAPTRTLCFLVSVASYLLTYCLMLRMAVKPVGCIIRLSAAGLIFAILLFYLRSPLENKNKKLPQDWKQRNRKRSFFVLGFWMCVSIFLFPFQIQLSLQILATIDMIAVLLIPVHTSR